MPSITPRCLFEQSFQCIVQIGRLGHRSHSFGREPSLLHLPPTRQSFVRQSGDTVSTVAILSERGITATYTYSSSLTADLFVVYLGKFVLPILEDGQTLIMDRHPVHRSKMVRNYLEKNNIRFLYLPPYSPMLNPIEEAFSKIKQYIKKQKARTINDLMPVLKNAFEIITGNDANGYFNHAAEF